MEEVWDLYDINKNKTGKTHIRGERLEKGEYHIVINAWIINSKKEVILTKRHPCKNFPNMWECTEGSILKGENSLDGAIRELSEEIGVVFEKKDAFFLTSFMLKNTHSIVDSFLFKRDLDISSLKLQENEVTEAKWVGEKEYREMCKRKEIVYSLRYFFDIYKV